RPQTRGGLPSGRGQRSCSGRRYPGVWRWKHPLERPGARRRGLVANNGRIVLGETTANGYGPSLTLIAGSDGIRLAGPIDLWDGDLILEGQGEVTQDGALRARGLLLLGNNA